MQHPLIWRILDAIDQAREWSIARVVAADQTARQIKARLTRLWELSAEPKPEVTFASFAFARAQDDGGFAGIGQWCCPHCGGDRFGSVNGDWPTSHIVYHCTGSSGQMPSTGCGYWETAYSPRQQGLGDPVTPERWRRVGKDV